MKLTKKKFDDLKKDEEMATVEYKKYGKKIKTTFIIGGKRVNFSSMSRDEHRHKQFLEKLEKKTYK